MMLMLVLGLTLPLSVVARKLDFEYVAEREEGFVKEFFGHGLVEAAFSVFARGGSKLT